ncbi:DUF885 family protein [Sphingomonas sp. BK235]|uniref:DUF885 family protein n=1 Tax=Sphingomonas sp. BK235 TaxID=2512131 RepID=UPI0010473CCC|nr:DUF885 family protein [Sphingomonas sp. BK235]TCP33729.1 uncharacterized protein DUF885 [Sphingomonas sp. BK235]
MIVARRRVLAALGAAAIVPPTGADAALRAALDAAATLAPDAALRRLAGVSARGTATGVRLDLDAARAGLRVDRALAAATRPAERFALGLRRAAGDDAAPDAVARALAVARDRYVARATRLFDSLGVAPATLGARYEAMWCDPAGPFADDAAGRAAAVAGMRATLDAITSRVPALLGALPPICRDLELRALDAAEIAAGTGGHRVLPAPGQRGGYVVDLREIRRRPRWTLPSVVAHELLPGHMAQLPLEALAAPHPLRLRYAAAFVEGWGSYAETLADAAGLFADPRDALGHLHWMLFRVLRGLGDVALHLEGRSESAVLADQRALMGEAVYFAPFASDLARTAATPGLRAAEAWLPLRLAAARPRARADWPRYHARLLRWGRVRTEQIAALA